MTLVAAQIAKVGHLSETQLNILDCLARRLKNTEINSKLFEGQKPTEELAWDISEIYKALGLTTLQDTLRKDRAIELFTAYRSQPTQDVPGTGSELEGTKLAPQKSDIESEVEKYLADYPTVLEDMPLYVERLTGASKRLKEMAGCIANDLDATLILQVSQSSVTSYVSDLYTTLNLTHNMGKKLRRFIIKAAYFKMSSEMSEAVSEPPLANGHATVDTTIVVDKAVDEKVVKPAEPPTSVSQKPSPQRGATRKPSEGGDLAPTGPGIAVTLDDPKSVEDVCVVSGLASSPVKAGEIRQLRSRGYNPEVIVVYPAADPAQSIAYALCVRRVQK